MNAKTKRPISEAYKVAWLTLSRAKLCHGDYRTGWLSWLNTIRDLIRELRASEARVAFWKDGHARREAEWQRAQERVRELEAAAELRCRVEPTPLPKCLGCGDTGKDPVYPDTNVCPDCYDKAWSAARRKQ